MLRVIGVVLSIGLADSMNPSTIAPALYLASDEAPLRNLTEFTVAVFATSLLGGAVILLGPGQALLDLVPHPSATTRYILELVAGTAMLVAAVFLWLRRDQLGRRQETRPQRSSRSSAWLGVTIMVVELPTAFPYFAAIAAVIGSGVGLVQRVILLALYNACFVLPLVLILGTVAIAGDRAERILGTVRDFLHRHWPTLLAGVALVAGMFVAALGATGLAMAGHTRFAHFSRRLRHVLSR